MQKYLQKLLQNFCKMLQNVANDANSQLNTFIAKFFKIIVKCCKKVAKLLQNMPKIANVANS